MEKSFASLSVGERFIFADEAHGNDPWLKVSRRCGYDFAANLKTGELVQVNNNAQCYVIQ